MELFQYLLANKDRLVISLGLVVASLMILSVCTYWFGMRDTWEEDNYSSINNYCDEIMVAINAEDHEAVHGKYSALQVILRDKTVSNDLLSLKISQVNDLAPPVIQRYQEQMEREKEQRRLQEEEEARIAAEESLRQRRAQARANQDASGSDSYHGFTESELERIYQRLINNGYSAEDAMLTMRDMIKYPDTRATLRQWLNKN